MHYVVIVILQVNLYVLVWILDCYQTILHVIYNYCELHETVPQKGIYLL